MPLTNKCEYSGLGLWRTELMAMSITLTLWKTMCYRVFSFHWTDEGLYYFLLTVFCRVGLAQFCFMLKANLFWTCALYSCVLLFCSVITEFLSEIAWLCCWLFVHVCDIQCNDVCVESLLDVFSCCLIILFDSLCCKYGNTHVAIKKQWKHSPPNSLRSLTMLSLRPTYSLA